MKKSGIILLSIVFLLSTFTFLPVKKASANTGADRPMLMAAWPWNEGDWNMAAPPGSGQKPANSPTSPVRSADKPEPQKVQQKPQRSFWSHLRVFFLNLKLLLGGK